jgi:hypothetical protein
MKSGKKSAVAKTMRVATTFTGAAACAAAFAPAATAATTHATAKIPYRPIPTARPGFATAATPANTGSIRSASCGPHPHWLHVVWHSPHGSGPFLTCFGFRGKFSGINIEMSAQCGGTNHGKFFPGGLTYVAGTTYRFFSPTRHVSAISIAGWGGNDSC